MNVIQTSTRYHLLHILRGIAALWIVGYHMYGMSRYGSMSKSATELAALPLHHQIVRFLGHNGVGSQLFFFISGYCVTAIALKSVEKRDWFEFLRPRLARIYIPFWCSLVVLLIARLVAMLLNGDGLGIGLAGSLPILSFVEWMRTLSLAQVFCSNGNDIRDAFYQTNNAYWFVAVAVQFYLIVALAVGSGRWFWWVVGGVSLVSVPIVVLQPPVPWFQDGVSRSVDSTGLFISFWPVFAAGALLYLLVSKGLTPVNLLGKHHRRICLTALLLMSGLLVGTVSYWSTLREPNRLVFAATYLLILWLLHAFDSALDTRMRTRRLLPALLAKAFLLVGTMSFSIYLIHIPLLQVVNPLLSRYLFPNGNLLILGVLALLISVVCAYPFYRYCEKPLSENAHRKKVPQGRKALAGTLVYTARNDLVVIDTPSNS